MTPLHIRLQGFTGIRSGLGRDEIAVDLEAIGDGLIAIKGPNGAGKSTLLDNLHPYRLMPSRAGGYSPGAFSYYDQVCAPEAAKELLWEHQGERYRSTILIRQTAKTRKQECFLHRQTAAGWVPVVLEDGTASDGKTDTYDRCVGAILGSPEMFFTAVFAAQSRPALSAYSNGEVKSLLSELLGLDDIRALGTRAVQVGKLLRGRLDGMRSELTRLATLDAELAAAWSAVVTAQTERSQALAERTAARERAALAERTLHQAEAAAEGAREAAARRADVLARLDTVKQEAADVLAAIDDDRRNEDARYQREIEASTARIGGITQQIGAADRQLSALAQTLARRDEIVAAQGDGARLATEEAAAEAAEKAARTAADDARTGNAELDGLVAALAGLRREGQQLANYARDFATRAALIDEVPCTGTDLQPRCRLLDDATTARQSLPAAKAAVEAKRAEWTATESRRTELSRRLEGLLQAAAEHQAAANELARIRNERRAAEAIAALAPTLTQAEQQQQVITETRAALIDSLATERDALDGRHAEHARIIAALDERSATARARRDASLIGIAAALAALPEPGDLDAVERVRADLAHAEQARDAAEAVAERAGHGLGAAQARCDRIAQDIAGGENVIAAARVLEDEIAHWQLLGKALGNDGIVALSIDDAGPTLASLANDLLLSCYGPRFSVSILTQEETAKGDLKESFDILVFDAERDDAKSVRSMSGGERIWINECLTRAIALYRGEQTGARYGTLFTDETDGPLDPERKRAFLAMKRKVLELGGYRREFFISHTPDLWDEADGAIDMLAYREAA